MFYYNYVIPIIKDYTLYLAEINVTDIKVVTFFNLHVLVPVFCHN